VCLGWRNEYPRSGSADGSQELEDHLLQRGGQGGAREAGPAGRHVSGIWIHLSVMVIPQVPHPFWFIILIRGVYTT